MRNRKLSREEAIEEYLVYQIRLYEFLHMFQIATDIMDGKYQPTNSIDHGPTDFFDSTRTVLYGLFASLMDKQTHALNIFDVWIALYPHREQDIEEVWKTIEPYVQIIRDFRNDVAFHANKDLRRYFETHRAFREKRKELTDVMQQFWRLAADLIRNHADALPDWRAEIEPALRKAFPDRDAEGLEPIKDYFAKAD